MLRRAEHAELPLRSPLQDAGFKFKYSQVQDALKAVLRSG